MTKRALLPPRLPTAGRAVTGATAARELVADGQWSHLAITVDLVGQTLPRTSINECRIIGSRFTGLDLTGARIVDAAFQDCDLSATAFEDAVLTRVEFLNCRMSGTILTSARLRDVRITDCSAAGLSMRMVKAERLECERTVLRDADFYQANLIVSRLINCDLTGAEFSKVTLADVRLNGSNLALVRGIEDLRGATIGSDQMHDFASALLAVHRITVDDEPIRR